MAAKKGIKDLWDYKVSKKRIFIPKDVIEIRYFGFPYGEEQVQEIIVEEGNPAFVSIDGVLFDKSMKTLLAYPKGRKGAYVIPQGTLEIDCRFSEYLGLTSIEIPSSVKTIKKMKFYACENLQNVTLHDGLEIIEKSAFSGCAIKAVVVPKTVLRVDEDAFSGCPDITIFDSIDPYAEPCCSQIDRLNGQLNSAVGCIGGRYKDHVITVLSAQTGQIKYKVWMDLGNQQRQYRCLLTSAWGRNASFCFPELDKFFPEVKSGDFKLKAAFRRMKYPYELTPEYREMYLKYISRNMKTILPGLIDKDDMDTLLFCETLGMIQKSNISQAIEYAVAQKSTAFTEHLQTYHLEKFGEPYASLTTNNGEAAVNTVPLLPADPNSKAELMKSWSFIKNADGTLTITGYRGNETEIIVPACIGDADVTCIAIEAFSPLKKYRRKEYKRVLKNIVKVTLPDSIREIGDMAFYGCTSLKIIKMPMSPPHIGKDVLTGCTKLYDKNGFLILDGFLYHSKAASNSTAIMIPQGVHTIMPYAFHGKRFLAPIGLSFPDTLKRIGDHAFGSAGPFTQLDLPKGLEEIGESAFAFTGPFAQLDLPNGLKEIGESAFLYCIIRDKRLVVPSSVKDLKKSVFWGCRFEEIWLCEGVETIGDKCFDQIRPTIHLPASLKAIGSITPNPKQDYENEKNRNPKYRISSLPVIYGPRGGTAEAYAQKNGLKFVEESEAQMPDLRDSDYTVYCEQRFAKLFSGLSAPLSLSVNHGGYLQKITFLAAESLEVIRQFYEEYSLQIPRFVIDDTADYLSEDGLRKLLASAPRNTDGQLSVGQLQFVINVFLYCASEEIQLQLVAMNVSRGSIRVYWRIYQSNNRFKSHRFHVLGQEMGV